MPSSSSSFDEDGAYASFSTSLSSARVGVEEEEGVSKGCFAFNAWGEVVEEWGYCVLLIVAAPVVAPHPSSPHPHLCLMIAAARRTHVG